MSDRFEKALDELLHAASEVQLRYPLTKNALASLLLARTLGHELSSKQNGPDAFDSDRTLRFEYKVTSPAKKYIEGSFSFNLGRGRDHAKLEAKWGGVDAVICAVRREYATNFEPILLVDPKRVFSALAANRNPRGGDGFSNHMQPARLRTELDAVEVRTGAEIRKLVEQWRSSS